MSSLDSILTLTLRVLRNVGQVFSKNLLNLGLVLHVFPDCAGCESMGEYLLLHAISSHHITSISRVSAIHMTSLWTLTFLVCLRGCQVFLLQSHLLCWHTDLYSVNMVRISNDLILFCSSNCQYWTWKFSEMALTTHWCVLLSHNVYLLLWF